MKALFKIAGTGLLGSMTLLGMMQTVAIADVVPLPTVITKKVTADITNQITLELKTGLSSSTWQTIGAFTGSTNLCFTNMPMVLIRGVCSNLTVSATLAWQPSIDPLVVGYKIYYGTASHTYTNAIDVGNVTQATVSNLSEGVTYYFSVTAYTILDIESPFSNEVSGIFYTHFSLRMDNS
jgi:Fibronectin type III domain